MTSGQQRNPFSFYHRFHFFTFNLPEIVSVKVDQVDIKKETGKGKLKRICWGSYSVLVAFQKNREQAGLCQVKRFKKEFCFIPEIQNKEDGDWHVFEHAADIKTSVKPFPGFNTVPLFLWVPYKVNIVVKWTLGTGQVECAENKSENRLELEERLETDIKEDNEYPVRDLLQCEWEAEKRKDERVDGAGEISSKKNLLERKHRYPLGGHQAYQGQQGYTESYRLYYKELKKFWEKQPGFRKED